ncbi:hypothetical protein JHL18_11760 [Clostridium sp. YIM B02505]|uniref:Nucleotidyltransferase n=1 Tax=Clostridium yunnanense TaxID=2800325 RepID=A0ABS1EPM3_9CLOT|nr:hypothetical protein [Clostridium yunnanense]MBK1811302.1 hypothetical protein [Clostridium yunnanense]
MFNELFYKKVIQKEIDVLVQEYHPYAIYLSGSFTTKDMWMLGISDIDVKVFTNARTNSGIIDLTAEAYNFFSCEPSAQDKVILSYRVCDITDFENEFAWKQFMDKKQVKEAGIITDQIFLGGSRELIYGNEINIPRIQTSDFRKYINDITAYLKPRDSYELFDNVKNILYAVKIYNYLWIGKYEYSNSKLFEEIKDKDTVSAKILEDVTKIVNAMNHDENKIKSVKGDYFLIARKTYRDKIKLFEHLAKLDKEYCKSTGSVGISQDFLSYQAFVDDQTLL